MMLLQYAARKSAEQDPIDWDALECDEEGRQGCCRRSTRHDHEAGSSGHKLSARYLFHMKCLALCMFLFELFMVCRIVCNFNFPSSGILVKKCDMVFREDCQRVFVYVTEVQISAVWEINIFDIKL